MSKTKMSKIKNVENKNVENYKCRNIILKYSAVFCLRASPRKPRPELLKQSLQILLNLE